MLAGCLEDGLRLLNASGDNAPGFERWKLSGRVELLCDCPFTVLEAETSFLELGG